MNSDIEAIKHGDRRPVQNAQTIVNELNAQLKSRDDAVLSRGLTTESMQMHWTLAQDSVGPCLRADITFEHPQECLKFAQNVHELQEATDHHSHFVMENFKSVALSLSTHHPVPAITTVDALFAKYVTQHFST